MNAKASMKAERVCFSTESPPGGAGGTSCAIEGYDDEGTVARKNIPKYCLIIGMVRCFTRSYMM